MVVALAEPWLAAQVSKVCGVEARGFILGSAVAFRLGVGFVAIRKTGSLFPGPKDSETTAPDYLVDDWAEKGSQALAEKCLIEQRGAILLGVAVMVDQLSDTQRRLLGEVRSIVRASELPPSS